MLPLRLLAVFAAAASCCLAAGARAEDVPELDFDNSVFDGDFLVVGAGLAVLPSYEGSDDLSAIPAAGVAGRLGGIGISARAAGFSLDLIRENKGAKRGISFGPVIRYRTNRTGDSGDEVVDLLDRLPGVVEGGFVVGTDFKGVLNPYDSLSASVDFRWDISGHGGGRIIAPGVSYITPVSRGDVVGLALSASFVDDKYANYNFGVSADGAAASGLPAYRASGGFKDFSVGGFAAHDLDGNLLNGGLAIGAGVMFASLQGSAAESPLTSLRGKRSQFIFGSGLAYTF